MSGFLEDPSVLTKEKLKHELLANNVPLPSGDHRKDVYVQLYLKTLTLQNKQKSPVTDTFSSDEDIPSPVVTNSSRSGRKATRKTDRPHAEDEGIADPPDSSLREQRDKYEVDTGTVVVSTRKVYETKLQKLLEQGPPPTPPLVPPPPNTPFMAPPPVAPAKTNSRQNGNTDPDQYSDQEEEERAEPEAEPLPVANQSGGSRGKTPLQSKTSKTPVQSKAGPHPDHSRERVAAGEETPRMNGENILKELLSSESILPTGISATCRRPIRGAAGRPVKESDFWLNESLLRRVELTHSSGFYSESRTLAPSGGRRREWRFLPMWLQLLLFSAIAGLLLFIYQAMETNHLNPFSRSVRP